MDSFKVWKQLILKQCNASSARSLSVGYALIGIASFTTWSYLFYVAKLNHLELIFGMIGMLILSFLLHRYPHKKQLLPASLGISALMLITIFIYLIVPNLLPKFPFFQLASFGLAIIIYRLWLKNNAQNIQINTLQKQLVETGLLTAKIPPAVDTKTPITIKKKELEQLRHTAQQQKEQLEKLHLELNQSYKDLELFAYVASHDLQEPLRMVGNFVQLLAKKYKTKIDPQGVEYIHYAVDGVNRMSKLIQALLQFSRVGRRNITLKSANPEAILRNALVYLQSQQKEQEVIFNIGDFPQKMLCEAQQTGIVFLQLLTNACKFNQASPIIITIKAEERSKDYWFMIEDNGIGVDLPEKKRKQIFEIFKKLHRKEAYEGTGIGLSLCHKIVQRHGGKIWYESTKDQGSRFYFTISKQIPYYEDQAEETRDASLFFQN
ncbi:MAG: ATP-binding protein [Saprospiraceae bacterium]